MLTMVAFTASCVGLLMFLWISFGGSLPLAPQGYRFSVEFDQAVELGTQAEVRISGVTRRPRRQRRARPQTGLTKAVIEINKQYAPRPADTRAILRAKTLLGETYVELTPGNPDGPKLPDGGSLPQAQVAPTVQLDQIFSTFDPTTRQAFSDLDAAGRHRAHQPRRGLQRAFAQLYPFATNVESVLAVLNRQSAATTHAAARRRPGVLGAEPLARGAPGLRAQLQRPVRRHRGAQRRPGRHDPGLPGVPASRGRRSTASAASPRRPSR